ncbi:MAG: hypothetical protein WBD46_15205 [Acidobacteriaceae bacterium]
MTDEEYREYLSALARTHVRPVRGRHMHPEGDELHYAIDKLSSTARFARVVSDRPGNAELAKVLGEELDDWHVGHVLDEMRRSGVLSALDEAPDITFGELRRNVIPEEDVRLLSEAGVRDPEAEITILIQYARKRLGHRQANPSATVESAREELKGAAKRIVEFSDNESGNRAEEKKRKIFNGIGKLLAGTVTAAGNLLLATGTIIAPNPATAYGVIGSSAIAVASICQGIGDLRGE